MSHPPLPPSTFPLTESKIDFLPLDSDDCDKNSHGIEQIKKNQNLQQTDSKSSGASSDSLPSSYLMPPSPPHLLPLHPPIPPPPPPNQNLSYSITVAPSPQPQTTCCKLFVGALPPYCVAAELAQAFSPFGEVVDCIILKERGTQKPKGK